MMRIFLLLLFATVMISCTNSQNPRIVISTQLGDIEAELYIDKAPVTAGNFLKYIDSGKYNNGQVSFYRVVRLDNQPLEFG